MSVDFKFAKGMSLRDLEQEVNRMLDKGWGFHGNPMVYQFRPDRDPVRQIESMVIQAMTRPKDVRFSRAKDNQVKRLQTALEASNALVKGLESDMSEDDLQRVREIQRDANLVFPEIV